MLHYAARHNIAVFCSVICMYYILRLKSSLTYMLYWPLNSNNVSLKTPTLPEISILGKDFLGLDNKFKNTWK